MDWESDIAKLQAGKGGAEGSDPLNSMLRGGGPPS
jgi:hypothetical protein